MAYVLNAVGTPRANGQIERYNATILDASRTSSKTEKEWAKILGKIQFALNNSVNSTTGKSPNELLMGYKPQNPSDAFIINELDLQL